MLLTLSFFSYFFCISLFSLISHPVYYCILLVVNSLLCSFICYSVYGFSWYALLFCLVYIGGVYILFVFVSVHNPNSSVVSYWNMSSVSYSLFIFFCLVIGGVVLFYLPLVSEFSSFLCTISEGYFYICMCLTLLFGFCVLSLVMSIKVNHYR
uniref:NADH dehydrogenase subunit 6 n=3 Tax=unclassified Rhinebothroides TaxID=2627538 RepID=A0A8K1SXV2_9CEST|nr:NADH dehydrogenase subunit 6 [Rhinebothroides sp. MZUSP 8027]UFQ88939.1 NADH dehydrogenase subunit 6 [Rhinebothroides sp. MZUSP 8028]UFQ88951.1 NADH dehydrogenase subunit 6 [Rhinebothroides sp. MZUSP 8029]